MEHLHSVFQQQEELCKKKVEQEVSTLRSQQAKELERKEAEAGRLRNEVSSTRSQYHQELKEQKAEVEKLRNEVSTIRLQHKQELEDEKAGAAKCRSDLNKLKQQHAAERTSSSSRGANLKEIATLKTNEADRLRERLSLAQQRVRQMALGMKTFFNHARSWMDNLHQHGSKMYEWLTDVEKGARHEPFNIVPYTRDELADAALSMFGVSKNGDYLADTRWWHKEEWESTLLGFCEANRLFGDLDRPKEADAASNQAADDTSGTWNILGELSDDELALVPHVQNRHASEIVDQVPSQEPARTGAAQQSPTTEDGTPQRTLDEMQSSIRSFSHDSSVAAAAMPSHDDPVGSSSAEGSFTHDRQANPVSSTPEFEASDTLDIDMQDDISNVEHRSATGWYEPHQSSSTKDEEVSMQQTTGESQAGHMEPPSFEDTNSIPPTTPSSARSNAASTPASRETPQTAPQDSPESAKQGEQEEESQSLSERKAKKNKKKYEKKKAKAAEMTADQKAAKQAKRLERKERAAARKAAEGHQGDNETE